MNSLSDFYILPLSQREITDVEVVGFNGDTKISLGKAKELAIDLLERTQGKYLYVTNGALFQALTGVRKASPYLGYVLPCNIKGYEKVKVVLGIYYMAIMYDPKNMEKLLLGLDAIKNDMEGGDVLGKGIIQHAEYPEDIYDIEVFIDTLSEHPSLAIDIETFSLRHNKAGIASIAFSWNENEGGAFTVELGRTLEQAKQIKAVLKEYFINNPDQTKIFHNATYDIKVLIYNLFMKDDFDNEGLLEGLRVFTDCFEDTRIIAYLATNSCAGNSLGLKELAHSYAGNYALEEIKDITKVPESKLLEYNLVDTLCTWFVYKKYYPIMVEDQQKDLYETLMKDSLRLIIQMELVGMPMDKDKIQEAKQYLLDEQAKCLNIIRNHSVILEYNLHLQEEAMHKKNASLKKKQYPIEAFKHIVFNPSSIPNLQGLFYDVLGLPVIDYTEKKAPAVGADTIEKLLNHTKEVSHTELLQAIIDYGKVGKILSAFIPAFENGLDKVDGRKWLHGSFNLGGTVSGRLSSSQP